MKLILDYSKWRCGNNGDNKLGKGDTSLMNEEGYYCCLGLFAPQLKLNITAEKLLRHCDPACVEEEIPYLNYSGDDAIWRNTSLSDTAIGVNDDPDTTPEEKIELLIRLFSKHELEIEVINKPLSKAV